MKKKRIVAHGSFNVSLSKEVECQPLRPWPGELGAGCAVSLQEAMQTHEQQCQDYITGPS